MEPLEINPQSIPRCAGVAPEVGPRVFGERPGAKPEAGKSRNRPSVLLERPARPWVQRRRGYGTGYDGGRRGLTGARARSY
jgi:hypothetical protein